MAAVLLPRLAAHVAIVDPWALSSDEEFAAAAAAGPAAERRLLDEVGRRNAAAIDSCDLLVAVLDGQEVDSGTAAEVGYAAARGVSCYGLRTDLRLCGEAGAVVNLQVEHFLQGRVARDLETLVERLIDHIGPRERDETEPSGPSEALAAAEGDRTALAELTQLLYWRWDPIGVSDSFPSAQDEYAGYGPPLLATLRQRVGVEEIAAQLQEFEREWIGRESGPEHRQTAAQAILTWFAEVRCGERERARKARADRP